MIHKIETLSEKALLQLLIDIETLRKTGFIDTQKAKEQMDSIDAAARRAKLDELLAQSGFSGRELVEHIQARKQSEKESTLVPASLSTRQQQVLRTNLKNEKKIIDSKLQALMDKFNARD